MTDTKHVEVVRLSRGRQVEKVYYDMLLEQAIASAQRLPLGRKCESEDLVEPDLWDSTDTGTHILIGQCIAHMVKHELLPLDFVGCYLCSNKQYIRI